MTAHSPLTRALAPLAALAAGALALTACSAGDLAGGDDNGGKTTITFLVDTSDASKSYGDGLAKAFNASQDDYVVEVETRPEGAEGDNLVKTRLSTGDMAEVFLYNTGSLLQALDPEKNLAPVPEGSVDDVSETFLETVTTGDDYYGVPVGTATGGGVLYNKKVFSDVGLEVPTTWDEFMANNEKIKAAGIDPVIQTYGGHVDLAALRARRLPQRRRGRPGLGGQVHRQRGPLRGGARDRRVQAPAGGPRRRVHERGLRLRHARAGTGEAGHGRGCAVPDAHLRARRAVRGLPGRRRGHRLLRPPR